MTLEQVKNLKHGDTVLMPTVENADGTPSRWRITGKVKTWKRDTNRVQVPIKRGLYQYGYLTENNMQHFELPEEIN